MGVDTPTWGPKAWLALHVLAYYYRGDIRDFLRLLGDVLPCAACRVHIKDKVFNGESNIFVVFDLHNQVNRSIKKTPLDFDDPKRITGKSDNPLRDMVPFFYYILCDYAPERHEAISEFIYKAILIFDKDKARSFSRENEKLIKDETARTRRRLEVIYALFEESPRRMFQVRMSPSRNSPFRISPGRASPARASSGSPARALSSPAFTAASRTKEQILDFYMSAIIV